MPKIGDREKENGMKNIYRIIGIAGAIWIGFFGASAHALTPGPITFNDNGFFFYSNFGNDAVTSATFEDHYTFTAHPPAFGGGLISVVSDFELFSGFSVFFDSIELWDVTDSVLVADGTITAGEFLSFTTFSNLENGNDYDIIVTGGLNTGHLSGAYVGNISIAPVPPVPEPEMYAMLLIGLALVTVAARRKQQLGY